MTVNVVVHSQFGEEEVYVGEESFNTGQEVQLDITEYDTLVSEMTNHRGIQFPRWQIEVANIEEDEAEVQAREAQESGDVIAAKLELFQIVLSEVTQMLPGTTADTKAIVASNVMSSL